MQKQKRYNMKAMKDKFLGKINTLNKFRFVRYKSNEKLTGCLYRIKFNKDNFYGNVQNKIMQKCNIFTIMLRVNFNQLFRFLLNGDI